MAGVWNGFLLGKARKEDVPCRFCGKEDEDGHLFWERSFPPIQHVRELPEFAYLMSLDRSKWPRCLLWHGCLPGLNGIDNRDPWATSFGDLASFHLERCLGAYPVDFSSSWTPPDHWDADDIALEMSEYPNIWTDGCREDFSSVGVYEVAGAGVHLSAAEVAFEGAVWGVAEEYGDVRLERCRVFFACSQVFCRLFSVLNYGVPFLLHRRTCLVIQVLTTLMLLGLLVGCWIMVVWLNLCLWSRMVT